MLTRHLEYHMETRYESIFTKEMLFRMGDASEPQIATDRRADAAYR